MATSARSRRGRRRHLVLDLTTAWWLGRLFTRLYVRGCGRAAAAVAHRRQHG